MTTTVQGRLRVGADEIAYDVRGAGRSVVLLHAGGFDRHMWDAQAEALAPTHRVVRYDTRGHGASSSPATDFHAGGDLAALLDHLGIARATLIGLSYGTRTAIELAVGQPERVEALVLAAPGVDTPTFSDPLLAGLRAAQERALADRDAAAWVDAFVRMWIAGPYRTAEELDPDLRRSCTDAVLATVRRHGHAAGRPVDTGPMGDLRCVTAPTLVVNGTLDSIDHHRMAGEIAAGIPGAETVEIDTGHMISLEAPARFTALVHDALAATADGPTATPPPAPALLRHADIVASPHRRAPVPGGELAYDVRGDGPPVVLLHGGMLDRRQWDAEAALLEPTHTVVRVDARGHGLSSTPRGDHRRHDDLRHLLDHLGIARATLVGLSLGARTALDTALTYPERVGALLLVSPGVSGMAFDDPDLADARAAQAAALEARDATGYVDGFLRMWVDGPLRTPAQVDAWLRDRCRRMAMATVLRHADASGQAHEAGAIDRLAEVTAPTRVVVGALDSRDIHDVAERIVAQVDGATSVTVADAAHTLTLERPHAWVGVLREFLDRHAP